MKDAPDVTVVGGGMAGMTAALKLLEAGFSVKVIEASSTIGGKFGAVPAKGAWHDSAWHVFGGWCQNFWDIARVIGLSRENDFVARPTMTLLRPLDSTSAWPRAAAVSSVGSIETFWSNANSGVAHWSDVTLFAYSQYALLCDASIDREEFLNRVTVNGYMRSLPYTSDVAALLHDELLLRIWAIPSTLISARAYRTYLTLLAPHRMAGSPLVVMKKNFEDGFWRPFLAALNRHPRFQLVRDAKLIDVRLTPTGDRVDEILVLHRGESTARPEKVRGLIVAIPPGRLAEVVNAPGSLALRERAPELLGLAKLVSQNTASLTLCFKRRISIPGISVEPVSLVDDLESVYAVEDLAPRNGLASEYGISFMDVTHLRGGADHPTELMVLASDADSLKLLDPEEACRRVLAEIRRFVRFDPSDVDWDRTYYQPHRDEPLFVNAVGSWEYRPEVRITDSARQPLYGQIWRKIRNLHLAGDYCRSQIDIVSLEGTVHTAMWAARALSQAALAAGTTGVVEVPEPMRPPPLDLEQVTGMRVGLERWAALAARRSRLVKEDLLSAARARGDRGRRPPSGTVLPVVGQDIATHRGGGSLMSVTPSTYPTFASPVGHDWDWVPDYPRVTKPVTLKSGAIVPIPVLFWETQALCVQGLADAESVDLLLRDQGLRVRHVDPSRPDIEQAGSGHARVTIWAVSYGGSNVGPVRSVHALVNVQPRRECRKDEHTAKPDHWWVWWYYGDSPLNQEFTRDVWGVPNELAAIELSYLTDRKSVRLLENGGTALRITCLVEPGSAAMAGTAPRLDPRVRLVARRPHDDGENWATVKHGRLVGSGEVARDDEAILYVRKDSTIDRNLRGVGFRARNWFFYGAHNGMVEIWDDKGSGKDPVRDTDDKYEVVRRGEGWLIREFQTP